MAKKNSTAKDTELSLSFFGKVAALFRSETVHFVIGLVLVIFSVYLLLAFSSFFFTGAADQSIIDGGSAQELISTNNGVKNYAGSRGAQLASYLINDCFGVSSFLQLTGFYHSLPDDIARFSLPLIGNLIKRYRNDLYLNINPV